jgi:hypothetical protein
MMNRREPPLGLRSSCASSQLRRLQPSMQTWPSIEPRFVDALLAEEISNQSAKSHVPNALTRVQHVGVRVERSRCVLLVV